MIAHIPNTLNGTTIDEIIDANPGWKVEREPDGSFTMSPAGSLSGAHDIALIQLLLEWNTRAGGQLFGSSAGFTMPDSSLRSPDASWISRERWTAIPPERRAERVEIVPDIWIEIVSRTDSPERLIAKLQAFRSFGAAYVLLIDPFRRTTWSEGTPPPGFPLDFTSVFDAGMH